MNSLQKMATKTQSEMNESASQADSRVVLVREAGVPYQPQGSYEDPIAEWISLMEVVQMLCPVWPARDKPLLGKEWRM
jgi:hypothetical protein